MPVELITVKYFELADYGEERYHAAEYGTAGELARAAAVFQHCFTTKEVRADIGGKF